MTDKKTKEKVPDFARIFYDDNANQVLIVHEPDPADSTRPAISLRTVYRNRQILNFYQFVRSETMWADSRETFNSFTTKRVLACVEELRRNIDSEIEKTKEEVRDSGLILPSTEIIT